MKLRADDDIYRVRLVWLGPPGHTLPFQLPYAQYGLFLALVIASLVVFVGATGAWQMTGVALAVAVFLTYYIWIHVDPDRPVRKVLKVALTDWRSLPEQPETKTRFRASHIRWTDIPGGRR